MKRKNLSGQVALVTGGARGIGLAVSRALLLRGARVVILGRDAAALREAARSLGPAGDVTSAVADVTRTESIQKAVRAASRKHGAISILVNSAGHAVSAPFLKTEFDAWKQMMSVNLDGTFHCTQAVLPGMLENEWGRIVNIASTAGLVGYPYVSAYCASKHAVIGMTRALALEVAGKGITVNAVCPGYTETEMLTRAIDRIVVKTGRTAEAARKELARLNPQGRFVTPEEVANAVLWLVMPGSEAITGQAIAVAGGEVMQ